MTSANDTSPNASKYYNKRAKIQSPEAKQRALTRNKDKTIIYQNWRIRSAGLWYSYACIERAMEQTRAFWKVKHGTNVKPHIGVLLSIISHYCMEREQFTSSELYQYLKDNDFTIRGNLSERVNLSSSLSLLVRDHFINPLSHHRYSPTNHLRLFMQHFDKCYQAIIDSK